MACCPTTRWQSALFSPADLQHICQNLNQFGYGKGTRHGGCQEYTIIPQQYAYLLTTDLDDARASILERELDKLSSRLVYLMQIYVCYNNALVPFELLPL